jgi:hypothetical protein
MGIGVVLIFYAIALSVLACVIAGILYALTYFLTKGAGPRRKKALFASVLFPFLCVAYAGAWFVAYASINSEVFHRDPGLGDSWETPLPNGYALMMIDVTDEGTVYNPKTQGGYGSVMSNDDSEFGVRQLQVSNNLILGARDSDYFKRIGETNYPNQVDTFFELDTKKNSKVEFKSLEELQRKAASDGIHLNLKEFASVFGDYRTTWFDYAAFAILLLVPGSAFLLLAWWVWRLRVAQPALPHSQEI